MGNKKIIIFQCIFCIFIDYEASEHLTYERNLRIYSPCSSKVKTCFAPMTAVFPAVESLNPSEFKGQVFFSLLYTGEGVPRAKELWFQQPATMLRVQANIPIPIK